MAAKSPTEPKQWLVPPANPVAHVRQQNNAANAHHALASHVCAYVADCAYAYAHCRSSAAR